MVTLTTSSTSLLLRPVDDPELLSHSEQPVSLLLKGNGTHDGSGPKNSENVEIFPFQAAYSCLTGTVCIRCMYFIVSSLSLSVHNTAMMARSLLMKKELKKKKKK